MAVVITLFFFLTIFMQWERHRRRKAAEELQPTWNAAGKDVVVLHMPERAIHGPNPSPFPIKLETWLRMNKVK